MCSELYCLPIILRCLFLQERMFNPGTGTVLIVGPSSNSIKICDL